MTKKKRQFATIRFHAILQFIFCISISFSFGQSFEWGKRGGSTSSIDATSGDRQEEVLSMATDSHKNVYVISNVGTSNINFDGHADAAYTSGSNTATALVSFACDGTFRWSKIIDSAGSDDFKFVKVDSDDNVYIVGHFGYASGPTVSQHIDVVFPTSPIDWRSLVIIKYNSSGQFQWYKKPEPAGILPTQGTLSRGLEIDSDGTLYWLVYLSPGVYVDGAVTVTDGAKPWYVLKYSSSGTFLNATSLDLSTPTSLIDLKFFRNPYNGNLFVSARAYSNDGSVWAIVGDENVTHGLFLSCYSASGEAIWKREDTNNTTGYWILNNLVFDTDNSIYLSGRVVGLNLDSFLGVSIADFYITALIMKIDAMATTTYWSTFHNKGAFGYGALIRNGNELGFTDYCAGSDFTWGTQVMNVNNPNDGADVLFARFNKDTGACLSLAKIPGNVGYEDYGTALAVDASGDYIIGGNFSGTLTFDGGAQITNSGGSSDFFITKYATQACSPLAVNDVTPIEKLRVYPNPVKDLLHVVGFVNAKYVLCDMRGVIVKQGTMPMKQSRSTGLL